ncbi:MAG: hypothetical protein J0I18_20245 [Actinobacteria bacterium]|nr:hypothetical protein [Actinomycetota bacterium]
MSIDEAPPRSPALLQKLGTMRGAQLAAAVVLFVVLLVRGVASRFVFDAAMYWNGAIAIGQGGDAVTQGGLQLRGVFSSLIYLPSALASGVIGERTAHVVVLAENAALVTLLAVVIVPLLARRIVPVGPWHVWVSAVLVGVAFFGFVPYTLMDVWALTALASGVLLLGGRRWWVLALGGFLVVVAVNLRPAYLVPAVLIGLVSVVFFWRRVHWIALGAIVGALPQVILNRAVYKVWALTPGDTFRISEIQNQYASFVVRYDTVAYIQASDPRQFYCSPQMAAIVAQHPPATSLDLVKVFVKNLGSSVVFALEKVGAALSWSPQTPYAAPPPFEPTVVGAVVIIVASLGFVILAVETFRRGFRSLNATAVLLLAAWIGTVGTLVMSAPETRFASTLVVVGVIGCLVGLSRLRRASFRRPAPWVVLGVALAIAVGLQVLAVVGLAHPATPGDVTAASCLL